MAGHDGAQCVHAGTPTLGDSRDSVDSHHRDHGGHGIGAHDRLANSRVGSTRSTAAADPRSVRSVAHGVAMADAGDRTPDGGGRARAGTRDVLVLGEDAVGGCRGADGRSLSGCRPAA